MYRQPIITVMGHIDSGKTTFLDKIKGTKVVLSESGKITQHIGATEITNDVIKKICSSLLQKYKYDVSLPGVLFIDTPGHNAFNNLRERGGSLADLVVLVVDINKGLQVQDIETLEILKLYKVPFIIVSNKTDLLHNWHFENIGVSESINNQSKNVKDLLDEKIYKIVGQLYEKGFSAERFDRVEDFTKQIVIIPTAFEKGFGISEAVLFISVLSQKFLDKKLNVDETKKAQAAVLEVGTLKGVGAYADVILYQGTLNIKDEICFPTKQGLLTSKVKNLLKLEVMSGIQKKDYYSVKEVKSACGVKVIAPQINECLPGAVIVLNDDVEAVNNLKERTFNCLKSVESEGAFVKADTLGSLEALLNMLFKNNICVAKADIGEVTAKDVLEAKILFEKNNKQGVIFLFNTNISKDLEQEIIKNKIPMFRNNIIYKLIEDYDEWLTKTNKEEKDKLLKNIIYPCKFKVLRDHIFRTSKPAVLGVRILEGKLCAGCKILNDDKVIGEIESIQDSGKIIGCANKEAEVAISLKGATYLKDFKENDVLKVSLNYDDIKKLLAIENDLTNEEISLIDDAKQKLSNEQNN